LDSDEESIKRNIPDEDYVEEDDIYEKTQVNSKLNTLD